MRRADTSGTFDPNVPESRPPTGAATIIVERARDQEQAGLRHGRAEAIAVRWRRLDELRDEDEGAEHPEADQEPDEIRRPDPAQTHHLHVHERTARPRLGPNPAIAKHGGRERRTRSCGARASPSVDASLIASEKAHQPGERNTAPSPVDVAGRANGRLGHERAWSQPWSRDHPERDPEQPVVVEMGEDRPCEDDPEPAPDPEQPRDERDAARHALARELVADDPEREGKDRAADALDDAGTDHHRKRRGERSEQRARAQAGKRDRRACASCRTCPRGVRRSAWPPTPQQVGREDPGHACRCRV